MNLADYNLLSLRVELQRRGWVQRTDSDDTSQNWSSTPHWGCCDLTNWILKGFQVAELTQLDLHPVVWDRENAKVGDDVYASCFVKADGSLTGWFMCEAYAGTGSPINAEKTTLDDLPKILGEWCCSWPRPEGWFRNS